MEDFLEFIINVEKATDVEEERETYDDIVYDPKEFLRILTDNENKLLIFTLYHIRKKIYRKIEVIPNKNWKKDSTDFLGIILRFESYIYAIEKTYRVLSVFKDSVAEKAGFIQQEDYVMGITFYKYDNFSEFIEILTKCKDKYLEVCLFNIKTNSIKFCMIEKDNGKIGCEFGSGILNQLPSIKFSTKIKEFKEIKEKKREINIKENIKIDFNNEILKMNNFYETPEVNKS